MKTFKPIGSIDSLSMFGAPLIKKELKPFSKLEIDQLASFKEFEEKCEITQRIKRSDTRSIAIIKNLRNTGYSIGKIYNVYDKNRKKMRSNINKYWIQYEIVKYSGLMEYFEIYFNRKRCEIIIHCQAYQETLLSFIGRNGGLTLKKEIHVKLIINDILLKLWRLHSYKYVFCDLKPSNIMERKLDNLYLSDFINDGWLLIDFNSMQKNGTKGIYQGSMGWSAPEINYNSKKNIYTYSSDIFSFGLIILFLMFGYQPLQIPINEIKKYENKDIDILYSKWYNQHILKSEYMIKNYLIKLYVENKISLSLFKLLHDGILIFDHKKRLNCKQIYYSEWLSDINQQ